MINELKIGTTIAEEIFYCKEKSMRVARNGSNYYAVVLQDKSGVVDSKIWDITDSIGDFEAGSFVKVSAQVGSFNNNIQLSITEIESIDESTVNMEDFCPYTTKDIDEMLSNLYSYIDSVKSEYLKSLLNVFFGNEKFIEKFKKHSAGKQVHHAFIGGLLEHTLGVTNICNTLSRLYPVINRDLLITAAICHDLGKMKELSVFPDNDYTDEGNLLGHIYIGAEMVDVQARKIQGFPKNLLNELKHCILAHHGKLEFGSPKTPMIIEAMALNFADDTDAKLRRFSDALTEIETDWSDKNDFFLGAKIRKTRGDI